jgi:hypothetical protein
LAYPAHRGRAAWRRVRRAHNVRISATRPVAGNTTDARPGVIRGPIFAALRVAVVALCTAPVWRMAVDPTFNLWRTDDGEAHLLRVFALDRALSSHLDYPRWMPDLYRGYGYPVFNYYPTLAYHTAALVHRIAQASIYDSVQALFVVAVVLGACGAAALARAAWPLVSVGRGSPSGPSGWWDRVARQVVWLSAGVAYAGAPYPFFTNLYFRADLPEALALGLLPWLVLAVHRLWHAPPGRVFAPAAAAAALGAALLLTHSLTALFTAAFAAAWVLGHAVARPRTARAGATRVAAAGLVALGVSCFATIPALAEGYAVQFDLVRHTAADVAPRLANPTGGTAATLDPKYHGSPTGAFERSWSYPYGWRIYQGPLGPEKPSLQQAAVAAVCLAGAVVALSRRRWDAALLAAVAVAGGAWLLNTTWSAPLWWYLGPLRFVQFPWRLYGAFSLALALGLVGSLCAFPLRLPVRAAVAAVLAAAVLAGSLPRLAVPHDPRVDRAVGPDALLRTEIAVDAWAGGAATGSGEFTPRDVVIAASQPGRPRGNQVFDRLYPPAGWLAQSAMVYAGRARIAALQGTGLELQAVVEAEAPGVTIAWHQFAFPGWRTLLDGQPVQHYVPPYRPDEDSTFGFILVDVPPGRHAVTLSFGSTPARLAGDAITLITLLVGVALAVRQGRGRRMRCTRMVVIGRQGSYLAVLPIGALALLAASQLGTEAWRTVLPGAGLDNAPNRVVVDVAEAARTGRAAVQSLVSGPLDVGWLRIGGAEPGAPAAAHGGRERRWLPMPPPAAATVRFRVPAQATFQSGVALQPEMWDAPAGDGVRFAVEVAGTQGSERLYDLQLNPRIHEDERRWVEVRVDLGAYAGQDVALTLRTELPGDGQHAQYTEYDLAGWGNPVVVVDTSIKRPGNGPRPPQSIRDAER